MPAATLDEVLEVLRARRDEARAIGIELVGVVGSMARGEARPDSDIDIVYDVMGRPTLFDLGGLAAGLKDEFHRDIDLVDREMMKPERWSYMARHLVTL